MLLVNCCSGDRLRLHTRFWHVMKFSKLILKDRQHQHRPVCVAGVWEKGERGILILSLSIIVVGMHSQECGILTPILTLCSPKCVQCYCDFRWDGINIKLF